MYVHGCNSILTTAMNNRSDKEMIRDFTSLTEYLKIQVIKPCFHFMDNEASTALRMTMTSMNIKYQLFPPSIHRANNVERAIQILRNHFAVVLCSVDKDFHLKLWDRLLQKATISLNLISQSRTLPHISAYTHIFGEFSFNCTPLAPLVKRVIFHNRPNDHALWAPHGEVGCYIGPAMEHYRCHKAYIPKTRAERISDTVEIFPKHLTCHRCLPWMQLIMPHRI